MTVRLSNFNELTNRLRRMSSAFQQEAKEIIEFRAGEIEVEAIRDAPGPGSSVATHYGSETLSDIVNGRGWTPISQAIGYSIINQGYTAIIFVERSAGDVAAWVEFGTGQSARRYLVTVPPEWRALAQEYYINGQGSILANPYLLPAFQKQQILMIDDLRAALRNLHL